MVQIMILLNFIVKTTIEYSNQIFTIIEPSARLLPIQAHKQSQSSQFSYRINEFF